MYNIDAYVFVVYIYIISRFHEKDWEQYDVPRTRSRAKTMERRFSICIDVLLLNLCKQCCSSTVILGPVAWNDR